MRETEERDRGDRQERDRGDRQRQIERRQTRDEREEMEE